MYKTTILRKKTIKVGFIAFDVLQLYPQQIWQKEQIDIFEKMLSGKDEKNQYQVIKEKYQILNGEKFDQIKSVENDTNINDQIISNKILSFLFYFEFENAKKEIQNWNPQTGLFILRKTGFLSYFSAKDALNYLESKKGIIEKIVA